MRIIGLSLVVASFSRITMPDEAQSATMLQRHRAERLAWSAQPGHQP